MTFAAALTIRLGCFASPSTGVFSAQSAWPPLTITPSAFLLRQERLQDFDEPESFFTDAYSARVEKEVLRR